MQFVEANGAKIPAIGLGTWELRGRSCARLVEQALKLGYRHIDTAQAYENERAVGQGQPHKAAPFRSRSVAAALAKPARALAGDVRRAGAGQKTRYVQAHRRLELHRGFDRRGRRGMPGTAGVRPGRIPSLSGSNQGKGRMRTSGHGF